MSTWTIRRVGDMARLINGHPFDSDDFTATGDVPLVRIRDITAADFETYVPQHTVPQDKVLKDGDVVIGMDGDFNVIRWRRGTAALNQRVCALRDTGVSDLRFLAYALPDHLKVINDLTYSTTVKHLSSGQVTGLRITAPDRDDQGRIADYLDRETATIDALIEKQRLLMARLKERMDVFWRELYSTALDKSSALQLRRHVQSISDGPFGSALTSAHYTDAGVRVIRLGNIGHGVFKQADAAFVSEDYGEKLRRYAVEPGDLVMAGLGDSNVALGRTAVVPAGLGPAINKADCFRLRLRPGTDPRYMVSALNAPQTRERVLQIAQGSTRQRMNTTIAAQLPIAVPAMDVQARIVERWDRETAKIDALIAKAERFIELAQERRAALITAAVTGQIEIPTED